MPSPRRGVQNQAATSTESPERPVSPQKAEAKAAFRRPTSPEPSAPVQAPSSPEKPASPERPEPHATRTQVAVAVQQDASSSSTAPQIADISMSGDLSHEQNSQKPAEGVEASVSEAEAEASPSGENHGAAQVAEPSADMIVEGIADICFLLP